jgi:phosphate transport system permease protein
MSGPQAQFSGGLPARHRVGRLFEVVCLACTWFGLIVLAVLLAGILWKSAGWLNWEFVSNYDSRLPERAGILAGLWGSIWLILLTALFSVPVGTGAAIYLEEYAPGNWLTRLIQVNLSNLAGVPSIVYGILGLTVFVRMFDQFQPGAKVIEVSLIWATVEIPLPLGKSVVAGALTLSLLVLPVVIIATQESLRAVPPSIRHAAYALGATRWQTIRHQVLPASFPGIATGIILSLSRAMGETAPLLVIGAFTYLPFTPGRIERVSDIARNPEAVLEAPFDSFTAIPILIYNWVSRPKPEYEHVAAAGIVVLLAVLLVVNALAIFIRYRFQTKLRW